MSISGHAGGLNGAGRMAYAYARLRSTDEEREASLEADPRVWRPDPDEGGDTPCVICEQPVTRCRSGRGLLCDACRAKGWTAATCECGAHLTRTDQTGPKSAYMRNHCKRCREEMYPPVEAVSIRSRRQKDLRAWRRAKRQTA